MAGGEGTGPPPALSALAARADDEWDVGYSRFFAFPAAVPPPGLKALPRSKSRRGGVWITAASLASLRLRPPTLSVSVPGVTYEEHFISKLNITWPQMPSTSEASLDGSRVVLFSFRDFSNKIQKFATRFSTRVKVQEFLKLVKESSIDMVDLGDGYLSYGNSSPKAASSKGSLYRHTVGGHDCRSCAGVSISAPAQNASATKFPLCVPITIGGSGVLPPSFNDFLVSCPAKSAQEESKIASEGCTISDDKLGLLDSSPTAANTPENPDVTIAIKEELVNYATTESSSSFHEKLALMEDIIAVVGDDMSL